MFNGCLLKERMCARVLLSIPGVKLTSAECKSQNSFVTDETMAERKNNLSPYLCRARLFSQVRNLV